jgi:multiple sugar transport system permease protein/alpha-1,4-digalacturonate transport system permease protein
VTGTRQGRLWLIVFLLPYAIGFLTFIGGPMAFSLGMSATKWSLFGRPSWVGIQNFSTLLHDGLFRTALTNTAYYAVLVVPAELLIALALALLLNNRLPGIAFFRGLYFMPFVLSLVSVGLLWTWYLSPNFGMVAKILQALHLPSPGWLQTRSLAMPAVAATAVWRNVGYYTVILLAGLQAIPRELEEAAAVDGARPFTRFVHVTLPLLTPTLFVALVVATIWAAHVFDLTYIMTQGGPENATLTVVQYIYMSAFQFGKMGYAAALSWILLLLMLLLTVLHFRVQRRWVYLD